MRSERMKDEGGRMKSEEKDGKLPEPENGFWALVELFGHQRIAGFVSEHQMGGETFIRVDVPEVKDCNGFTRLYGKGAIYSVSPAAKELVLRLVAAMRVVPIQPYELRGLPAIEHGAMSDE